MSYEDFSDRNIGLKGRYVIINKLDSHGELGVIVSHLSRHFNNPQTKKLSITISPSTPMYGNLVVPLSAILINLQESGRQIRLNTTSDHIERFCLLEPPLASTSNFQQADRILDKIWRIENEFHLNNTVDFLRRFFQVRLGFNQPVLQVLELAIIEGIENALIHSETGKCLFMGQYHSKQKYFTLCISDTGIGIKESLSRSGVNFRNEAEYLANSIKKGVTSKHFRHFGGNGLYCLSRLAKTNGGHFGLWSGTTSLVVDGKTNHDKVHEHLPHLRFSPNATHLDFQLPLNEAVSADYDELPIEDNDLQMADHAIEGEYTVNISELEHGYCTRLAGEKARELIARYLEFPTVVSVVIDFSGIPICSMSFLDSFVGVLSKQLGKPEFTERIRIRNATLEIRKSIVRLTNKC